MKTYMKRSMAWFFLVSFMVGTALTMSTTSNANADQTPNKSINLETDLLTFYLNPTPESISKLLPEIRAEQLKDPKNGFSFIGVMSSVFLRYPDKAEEWLANTPDRAAQIYMARALWLAGRNDLAKSAMQQNKLPARIVEIIERSPNSQADFVISSVSKMNIAVGMFGGSGDLSHLKKITDYIFDSVDNEGIDVDDVYDYAEHYGVDNTRNAELISKYKERGKPVIRRFLASAYGMTILASLSSGHESVSNWLKATYPAPWSHAAGRNISRLRFLYENQQVKFIVNREQLDIFTMLTYDENDLKRLFSKDDEPKGITRTFPKSSKVQMATFVRPKMPFAYEFEAIFIAPDLSEFKAKAINGKNSDKTEKLAVSATNFVVPAEFLNQQGEYTAVLRVIIENQEVLEYEAKFLIY